MVHGPAHMDIPKLASNIWSEVILFISHIMAYKKRLYM